RPACARAAGSRPRPSLGAGSCPRRPRAHRPGSAASRPPLRSGRAARRESTNRDSVGLLDEADCAARLEDRPLHLVERPDLLLPGLLHQVLEAQALTVEVPLDRLAVLD